MYSQRENNMRIRGTNPNYEIEDWVSYSMTRWTKSLTQGIEYVYFGTTGGITRYNYFTNKWDYPWTVSNGLADNDIFVVAYDNDTNYLWCATPDGISCYFSTFRRWENYYYDEIGIPENDEIISIGFDENDVWIESYGGRLLKGSKHGGGIFQYVSSSNARFSGSIRWFGYRFRNTNRLPRLFMSGGYWFDSEGFITDIRLNRYDVSVWLLDKWGNYWIGTLGLGAGKAEVRIEQFELLSYGLFIDNVSAMALDTKDDIMWIGGIGEHNGESGITSWKINSDEWIYFQAKYITGFQSDHVTSIALDDTYIWFGTDFGVARYDKNDDSWRNFDVFSNLADNYVFDVATDDENVWIATDGGLTRILKKSLDSDSLEVMQISSDDLRRVKILDIELMNNLVWLGTELGVYVYDMRKNIGGYHAEAGEPMGEVVYAVSCFENEVWFGLSNGIEIFDVDRKEWLGVPQRRFYSGETITYIKADKEAVWAGTDQGVLKFDRQRKLWRKFTTEDGLIDNVINTILVNNDYVWFGTPKGITRFYWNDPHRID